MKRSDLTDIGSLVEQARGLYDDDTQATALLDGYSARLRDPLRLAVAGMVKAGKSTILNAIIGERIAPTDAGECTRTIVWYRYARTSSITAHLHGGEQVRLPIRRSSGSLELDLGRHAAEDVDHIDVRWPAESLRSIVLIDTPGIASLSEDVSARSTRFLSPERSPSEADAILYLLRHIHASDVAFLEAFHDTAVGASQTVNAVAVLSRADEVGSGRIDSLLSAAKIAGRYRRDGELRALALGCIPVAGLLAEGARTLRESEFAALRELASLDRGVRERMMISVDRFTQRSTQTTVTVDDRRALLHRFGIFGVRLGTALVRGGATTSSELADRLVAQSGLVEVQQFVSQQFRARATALKARGVLTGLEQLLRERHRPGAAAIRAGLERIVAGSHDLRELALLAAMRTQNSFFRPEEISEAERIVGGSGTTVNARLGLPEGADVAQIQARIDESLDRWRARSASPLIGRADVELCRVVIRSIEGAASDPAMRGARAGSDAGPSEVAAAGRLGAAADVVLARGPAQSGR